MFTMGRTILTFHRLLFFGAVFILSYIYIGEQAILTLGARPDFFLKPWYGRLVDEDVKLTQLLIDVCDDQHLSDHDRTVCMSIKPYSIFVSFSICGAYIQYAVGEKNKKSLPKMFVTRTTMRRLSVEENKFILRHELGHMVRPEEPKNIEIAADLFAASLTPRDIALSAFQKIPTLCFLDNVPLLSWFVSIDWSKYNERKKAVEEFYEAQQE